MDDIVLGAYASEQEAIDALALRGEPSGELRVVEDGDAEHPWRNHWLRQD